MTALLQRITWMLNLFENDSGRKETDYRTIYRYRDGRKVDGVARRQITLGRGFTEDGGSLRQVVDLYLAKGGKSALLREKAPQLGRGMLVGDTAFLQALSTAADEPPMRAAQDEIFQRVYLDPALHWAEREGFQQPLSSAITADSFLHSGRMTPSLVRSFSEPTPAHGGREAVWMRAYTQARLDWFQRASGPLHTCIFRPRFFLAQITAGNWSFAGPLEIPGKGSICS
jgi:chitosanase